MNRETPIGTRRSIISKYLFNSAFVVVILQDLEILLRQLCLWHGNVWIAPKGPRRIAWQPVIAGDRTIHIEPTFSAFNHMAPGARAPWLFSFHQAVKQFRKVSKIDHTSRKWWEHARSTTAGYWHVSVTESGGLLPARHRGVVCSTNRTKGDCATLAILP